MARHRLAYPVAIAVLGAMAACAEPTGPINNPAAVDSLLVAISDAQSYGGPGMTLGGMPPTMGGGVPMPSSGTAACTWDAATQFFVCPTVALPSGMSISRKFQLLDADGDALASFQQAKVAAIRTVIDATGSRPFQALDGTPGLISHTSHADQTLSGLLVGTPTLNGTSTITSTITADGTSSTFTMKQTMKDLVLPARGERYPRSGSITMEMSTPGPSGEGTTMSILTMTYNGTSIVTMTFTSGGTTRTCQVDMSQPTGWQQCAG